MLKMVGQDIVSGAMGFVGTEPGKLYRMGSLNGVAEASGNPLTLKRCKNKPLRGLTIYGKSEQFKTTGANSFNVDSKQSGFVSGIKIGDKVEVSQNASYPKAVYFDEIAVDPTKRYSFCFWDGSTVLSNDNVRIRIYNDDNVVTEIPAKNNVVNKKFADGTTKVRVLILDKFPNLVGMFCEGSTLKAYEPYTGGQPSPSPDYPQEIKSVVNPVVKISNGDGTESQTVALPYTLNAIPVPSGGNYTDENGQQWIADYVDMAKGKLVRNILKWYLADIDGIDGFENSGMYHFKISKLGINGSKIGLSNMFKIQNNRYLHTNSTLFVSVDGKAASLYLGDMTASDMKKWIAEKNPEVYSLMLTPQETPLTPDEIAVYKTLHTYTGITNISNDAEAWMQVTYNT